MAMECRCYRGGEGRTRLKQLHLTRNDWAGCVVCLVAFGVILATNLVFQGL